MGTRLTGLRRPLAVVALLLFVSIGANLFFAGWFVGQVLKPEPPGPADGLLMLEQNLAGRMSPEGYARLKATFDELRAEFGPESGPESIRRQMDDAVRSVAAVIEAEGFDQARFRATVDAALARRQKTDLRIVDRMATVLTQLGPKDRRLIAEQILRGPFVPPPPPGR